LNEDFLDMLRALQAAGARFLIVGAHALAGHGLPRATGDLDIWVEATTANAACVWQALIDFGLPIEALGIRQHDFTELGMVVQVGLPPRRIDLMTSITAVEFNPAWDTRVTITVAGIAVPVLGRESLLANKRALGRPQDLADVDALSRQRLDAS
jgi:hypothetical protein